MADTSFGEVLERRRRGLFPFHRAILLALFFGMLPLGWCDAGCHGAPGHVMSGVELFKQSGNFFLLLVFLVALSAVATGTWFIRETSIRAWAELVSGLALLQCAAMLALALLANAVFENRTLWPPATIGVMAMSALAI